MARKPKRDNGSAADAVDAATTITDDTSDIRIEVAGKPYEPVGVAATDDSKSEPGVTGNGKEFSDPSAAVSDAGSDTTSKRRGRPIGSRNASRANKATASSALEAMLFSLHLMGAALFKTPELLLNEDEAKQLGAAANRVAELYELSAISEKALAWIQLGAVAGQVYGPRFIAMRIRVKKEQAERPKPVAVPGRVAPTSIRTQGIAVTGANIAQHNYIPQGGSIPDYQ